MLTCTRIPHEPDPFVFGPGTLVLYRLGLLTPLSGIGEVESGILYPVLADNQTVGLGTYW